MNNIIDLTSTYILVFAFGFFAKACWNSWLIWREKNFELDSEKDAYDKILSVHSCAKDFYSEDKLKTSLLYERTCSAFNVFHGKIFQRIMLGVLAFGLVPYTMHLFFYNLSFSFIVSLSCTVLLLSFLDDIISLPFSYYENFKLETKFGFNTMTIKTFVTDFFKNIAVSSVYNVIQLSVIVSLLFAFHKYYGNIDWKICLVLSVISVIASMVMEVIDMKVIIPLFNKLSPMEDSPLKTRMEKMMNDFGFNSKGVFVIDASKRSKHSNAYCSGWGKNKSLVIYDTMLKNFTDDEIMAILGHELAHSKLNHLVIDRILSFIQTFMFLFISTFFIYDVSLYHAFGFSYVTSANVTTFSIFGFWLFGKIYGAFSWILDGIESYISRSMEYAADRNSCKYNNGNINPMITALFKLYGENLSYPFNDSLYEAWNFSHPGFVNRISALKNLRFCKDCFCNVNEYNDCGRVE